MGKEEAELVTWTPAFSVGIEIVDEQHKGLLDMVNDMFNHVSGDAAEEDAYIAEVIQKTVRYIKVHFNTEEDIMIRANFPGYKEHKAAHDAFVLTVVGYIDSFDANGTLALADFTRFLKEWILTHIAVMDKQYFEYFKQSGEQLAISN